MTKFGKHVWWLTFLILIFAALGIWYVLLAEGTQEELRISFLDVGQGDAIYIESPTGMQVLVDGGPNKKVLRELGKHMSFWDRSIDMVIATHPDLDHIGGLPSILKRFAVSYYVKTDVSGESGAYVALEEYATGEAQFFLARRGDVIDLGGGAYLEILFPDRSTAEFDANLASVVLRLVYGETSVLLTGDAPVSIENYLSELYGEALDSDILKLGHHGSKTSTGVALLGFSTPDIAIVSAGEDNRYGHPHREVLDRLEQFNIPYLETKHGSITFVSNGKAFRQK